MAPCGWVTIFFGLLLLQIVGHVTLLGCWWALGTPPIPPAITGSWVLLNMASLYICMDLARSQPARSLTFRQLATQYLAIFVVRYLGGLLYYTYLLPVLKNCREVQEKRLLRILNDNRETMYGRKHGLADIRSREDFIDKMPLTTYEHYEGHIERVANGEKGVMTKEDVVFIALTSGTTGHHKMYPISAGYSVSSLTLLLVLLHKNCGRLMSMRRTFNLRLQPALRYSPAGIKMAGATVLALKPPPTDVIPLVAQNITQEVPSFFVQAVFVLAEDELDSIAAFSSNILYSFFKFMEFNWVSLCDAIEFGHLPQHLGIPTDVEKDVKSNLRPQKKRAAALRVIFQAGMDGLAMRLWPQLRFVCAPKSGGFALSASRLQALYLRNLPSWVYLGHVASEGMLGFNIEEDTEQDIYTCLSTSCFQEFIPIEDVDKDSPKTVFMDQVQAGRTYEIVVTNRDGLYRFRLGDVIEIVGFHYSTPKYRFLYRLGQSLNLVGEKTPEATMYESLQHCARHWRGRDLVDYTTTESLCMEDVYGRRLLNCYFLFVEVAPCQSGLSSYLTQAEKRLVDECLCSAHEPYHVYRLKGSLAPATILPVSPGTFEELRMRLACGYPNMQFKMPRVLRTTLHLTFMLSRVIKQVTLGQYETIQNFSPKKQSEMVDDRTGVDMTF